MILEKLIVTNFRCFGPSPIEIDLNEGLITLVGNNGSGKTATLQALSRLFGTTKDQRFIKRQDFHISPLNHELETGTTLSIEAVIGFPELSNDLDSLSAVPEFFRHMIVDQGDHSLKAILNLTATWTDDGTPEGAIEEEINWITDATDKTIKTKCTALQRSTIQFIYLPANRDALSQVTSLLKGRLWKAAKWSNSFQTSSAATAAEIQKNFNLEEPAKTILASLTKQWNAIHSADTDSNPNIKLVANNFEELIQKAEFTFSPNEEGKDRPLSELSDGQRSLFHMALTIATLETEQKIFAQDAISATAFETEKLHQTYLTILGIEEPENSLSPFFLSRIIREARKISSYPNAQIILSSHSPAILGRIEASEIRYVLKDKTTLSSTIKKLTLPSNDLEASAYIRLAVKAYPELYFARFVILGEGDSERIVISRLAELLNISLDPSFVAIVPLGGRYVGHFWRLLEDLQIPYATLRDLDLGRQHGGKKTLEDSLENLQKFRKDDYESLSQLITKIDNKKLLSEGPDGDLLKAFRNKGIFFSFPIDIDFAMLRAFPSAYRRVNRSKTGPRATESDLSKKKTQTLKTQGDQSLFDQTYDKDFLWYPYLFLDSKSKPNTHFNAFTQTELSNSKTIKESAPSELIALITYVKNRLEL